LPFAPKPSPEEKVARHLRCMLFVMLWLVIKQTFNQQQALWCRDGRGQAKRFQNRTVSKRRGSLAFFRHTAAEVCVKQWVLSFTNGLCKDNQPSQAVCHLLLGRRLCVKSDVYFFGIPQA
ncbi:MAG: hypothetical protein II101_06525, partial [Ruminococcus sp.]|nr:hypothetical protein [Ruminococcus sp.]